ncbi:MAG: hypothetical protein ACI8R4_003500 [Paracoccaceae bacterium]|jgi:hypothetical protein
MLKTYQGACHYGRIRFSVTADIDHVRVCDCSICHQRGALIFRVANHQLRHLTPLADAALYEWGTGTAKDYFCKTCGILPFRRPRQTTPEEISKGRPAFTGWAVNARCLAGLDTSTLAIRHVYASRLPLPEGTARNPQQPTK